MKSILSMIWLLLGMLMAATAWSHGVDGYIEQMNGYCVTASYDDGEPMNYAAVEIRSPNSDTVFQTGHTDRNGRFMFLTDGRGQWKAVVKDGMGHQLSLDLEVSGDNAAQKTARNNPETSLRETPRVLKVVDGLSIIFGLCGFLYGWKYRRIKSR